jgi:preprotein translocase subunit YajC
MTTQEYIEMNLIAAAMFGVFFLFAYYSIVRDERKRRNRRGKLDSKL